MEGKAIYNVIDKCKGFFGLDAKNETVPGFHGSVFSYVKYL